MADKKENAPIKTDTYADKLSDAVSKATTSKYDYDWNADALYNNYKDTYMTEAQKAKSNVINAGNALTGGRSNTYVDSSANQQYQKYMTEINRLAPTFEKLNYNMYSGSQEDLINNASMLSDLSNTEYDRYRDIISSDKAYRDYQQDDSQYAKTYELNKQDVANSLDTADKNYEQMVYQDRIEKAEAEKAAREKASSGSYYGSSYDDYYDVDFPDGSNYLYGNDALKKFQELFNKYKIYYKNPTLSIVSRDVLDSMVDNGMIDEKTYQTLLVKTGAR